MVDIDLVAIEVAKLLFDTNIHFSELIHQTSYDSTFCIPFFLFFKVDVSNFKLGSSSD
jgi:hypothetical protein